MSHFTLFSDDVSGQADRKQVFNAWGCTGENLSPALSWSNAPEGTKSFAITLYDPDAPTGSGWWHWLVFDIPVTVSSIPTGAGNPSSGLMPEAAIQSLNDYSMHGYGGPCPPEGDGIHQYVFTLYALDVEKLGPDKNTNPAVVGFNINAHVIQKASLVMYHERK